MTLPEGRDRDSRLRSRAASSGASRRTRLLFLVVGAVVLATVVAVAVMIIGRGASSDRPSAPIDPVAGAVAATEACDAFEQFVEAVRRDRSSGEIQEALSAAVALGEEAARQDPRWVALAGGLESVEVALEEDSARAARVGTDVVYANCALARRP